MVGQASFQITNGKLHVYFTYTFPQTLEVHDLAIKYSKEINGETQGRRQGQRGDHSYGLKPWLVLTVRARSRWRAWGVGSCRAGWGWGRRNPRRPFPSTTRPLPPLLHLPHAAELPPPPQGTSPPLPSRGTRPSPPPSRGTRPPLPQGRAPSLLPRGKRQPPRGARPPPSAAPSAGRNESATKERVGRRQGCRSDLGDLGRR